MIVIKTERYLVDFKGENKSYEWKRMNYYYTDF